MSYLPLQDVLGAQTDVAVTSDVNATVSAKLRGLTKINGDVWDSANHRIRVGVANANSNGQATMANSAPVVIASDQTVPTVSMPNIQNYIRNGQGFNMCVFNIAVGSSAGNWPFAIFNPSGSGKTAVIYKARATDVGNPYVAALLPTTVDPAYATSRTPVNSLLGSANASVLTASSTTTSQTLPGTTPVAMSAGTTYFLTDLLVDDAIVLTPGNGVTLWITQTGTSFTTLSASLRWVEF